MFLEHGVAVLPCCVDDVETAACASRAVSDLAAAEEAIAARLAALDPSAPGAHHEAVRCQRCDFAEVVRRDGGRVDCRVGCGGEPYASLFRNRQILSVARAVLGGGDVVLLYAGVMVARAGQGADAHQRWHKDGDHLFSEEGATSPPHALTVFVPLQDLTPSNGPTEFRLGSQRRRAAAAAGDAETKKRKRKNAEDAVAVTCRRGSALFFDYRVDHRGTANVSDTDRLVVFLAYARPWFRDTTNTRSKVALFPDTFVPWAPRLIANDEASTTALLEGDDSGERFVLFEMTVELDDEGAADTIRVHDGDVVADLARAFCEKHALPDAYLAPLAESIASQMALARSPPP